MRKSIIAILMTFCLSIMTYAQTPRDRATELKEQAQSSLNQKDYIKARYLFKKAYEAFATRENYPQAIESGVQANALYVRENFYKEGFELCRDMDQLIWAGEQNQKKVFYDLRFLVNKERLQMYTALKNPAQAKTQLNKLEETANLAKNDSLTEVLLYTKANYYYTFNQNTQGDACFRKLINQYKEKKDYAKVMFQAMPVPMRIFEELSGEGDSPVTVREGREWLEKWREEKKTSENSCKNQAETVEKKSDDRDRESAEKLSDTQESETVDTPEKGRKTSLFGLFSKKSAKGSDDQQPQTVLEARDVWFRYEKELPDVVRDLNLKVQKGELYCLLGGNGTGKSTTLRLLGRIKKPYRGKLFLNGKELGTYRESELYGKLLGILPQNPQSLFVKDTVEKDLREISGDSERLRDVIEKTVNRRVK